MSNSNYSIGLQRLKPVHTAYTAPSACPSGNLNWSWARDVNGQDRDETETSASRDRDDTETMAIFLETRPRRDVGTSRDRLETETSRLETETTTLNGHLTILKLQSVTQLDTRVKSTITGTVTSSGRGGTAAAMMRNEQTAEEHSTLEQQPPGRLAHQAWCVVWTVQPASTLKHSEDADMNLRSRGVCDTGIPMDSTGPMEIPWEWES